MKIIVKYLDGTEETVPVDEGREGHASLILLGDGTYAGRRNSRCIPYDRIKEYLVIHDEV